MFQVILNPSFEDLVVFRNILFLFSVSSTIYAEKLFMQLVKVKLPFGDLGYSSF